MFVLKLNHMPFTVNLLLTSPVGQYSNDLEVVGVTHGAYQRTLGELVKGYSTG